MTSDPDPTFQGGSILPVSDFLKPAPWLVPQRLWRWCARRFYRVDESGHEQLKSGPTLLPFRWWRFLGRLIFTLDVYKLRAFQLAAPTTLKEAIGIAPASWLYAGTLLGCVRDGRIIAWDRDIDIGFPSELMTDELIERFRAAGFSVEHTYVYSRPSYREYIPDAMGRYGKVVLRKGAKIEFYCFVRGKDGRLYYGQGRPQLFVIDHELVYPQKQVPFYDFMVNVPERLEENLAYMYGPDWRTPKPRYIRSTEHRARQARFFIPLEGQ
jgi:hypothetical protein